MTRVKRAAVLLGPVLIAILASSSARVCAWGRSLDQLGRVPKPSSRELPGASAPSGRWSRIALALEPRLPISAIVPAIEIPLILPAMLCHWPAQPRYLKAEQSTGLSNDLPPPFPEDSVVDGFRKVRLYD